MLPPYGMSALVVGQDPDNYAVLVQFPQKGGEQPVLSARVLVTGPCDGLRIEQRPLPGKGTWGVVHALNGDPRSLVWAGAFPANANDAITTTDTTDMFVDYSSHWSGYYKYLDNQGNLTMEWPDQSQIIVGTGPPTLYSHNASSGTRTRQELTYADRVATPPSQPFPMIINHASGVQITITSAGAVSISAPENITITTNENITATAGGTVTIQGDSKITLTGDGGTVYRLVDERLITLFNNHVHDGVTGGDSDTGPPTVQMAVGSQTTLITYAN